MTLSGTPSISGTTVTLTLAAAVVAADTDVKVSYTRPDSGTDNKLEDAAGNAVDSFADQAVTNATAPGPDGAGRDLDAGKVLVRSRRTRAKTTMRAKCTASAKRS